MAKVSYLGAIAIASLGVLLGSDPPPPAGPLTAPGSAAVPQPQETEATREPIRRSVNSKRLFPKRSISVSMTS